MDTLAHSLMGAALFSRTGLAGGRRGPVDRQGRRRRLDWTFWAAVGFGLAPDALSIGLHFAAQVWTTGRMEWRGMPGYVFLSYNLLHSLPVAAMVWLCLYRFRRAWILPALAWPFHIVTDVFTHGSGVFLTPVFWPFSTYRFHGVSWWENSVLFKMIWAATIGLWLLVGWLRTRPAR